MTNGSTDESSFYVYIVRCRDGTLYTGYTTNIHKRLSDHNNGKGAKYTRGRKPVVLCYLELLSSKSDAMKKEYEIKQLTRIQKETLIAQNNVTSIL